MSLIVHRCDCGHVDIFHTGPQCCAGRCRAGTHNPKYGPPEVIPTWNQATGKRVEEIAEPGTKHAGFGIPLQLCGCDACREVYYTAQLLPADHPRDLLEINDD
jgi:hypothetical protein